MAQPKHPKQPQRPGHDRDRDREREDSGDDPKRHAAIIERRWLGSPPPTLERYARALRQWQALPGAVVRTATDVTVAAEPPAPAEVRPEREDGESNP